LLRISELLSIAGFAWMGAAARRRESCIEMLRSVVRKGRNVVLKEGTVFLYLLPPSKFRDVFLAPWQRLCTATLGRLYFL
jgi:hypothetical protein